VRAQALEALTLNERFELAPLMLKCFIRLGLITTEIKDGKRKSTGKLSKKGKLARDAYRAMKAMKTAELKRIVAGETARRHADLPGTNLEEAVAAARSAVDGAPTIGTYGNQAGRQQRAALTAQSIDQMARQWNRRDILKLTRNCEIGLEGDVLHVIEVDDELMIVRVWRGGMRTGLTCARRDYAFVVKIGEVTPDEPTNATRDTGILNDAAKLAAHAKTLARQARSLHVEDGCGDWRPFVAELGDIIENLVDVITRQGSSQ